MQKIQLLVLPLFVAVFAGGYSAVRQSPMAAKNNLLTESVQVDDLSSQAPSFQDVTAETGVMLKAAAGISFGDVDNDGWVDMLAGGELYKNVSSLSQIRFKNISNQLGGQKIEGTSFFVDINNDGLLDILTQKGQVFVQSASGQFQEKSQELKFDLPEGVHTLSPVDVNGDGYLDLMVGMSEKSLTTFLPPKLYINHQGKELRNWTPAAFKNFPNYIRNIAVADFNNDGQKDVYFSNYRIRPNNLFKLGMYGLIDMASYHGVQGVVDPKRYYLPEQNTYYGPRYGHTISSVWADLNNDGLLDLWVSNLVHKFAGLNPNKGTFDPRGYLCDDSKIYKNNGPPFYNFTDMRYASGIDLMPMGDFSKFRGDELWAQTTIADFDNDGLQDVYVSQVYDLHYAHSLLFKNLGNFRFKDVGAQQGTRVYDSYAGAWADLNNDGKMDLVQSGRIKNKTEPVIRIHQNVTDNGNNYLKVRLRGTTSGTMPVTAQVRIFHPGGVFLRQQEGTVGTYNQQNDPTLHFGLGAVSQIYKMEIRWPSGKKTIIEHPKINTTLLVKEK